MSQPSPSTSPNPRRSVLVLASGGLDSTACIAFYRARAYDVEALFVDYGQPALAEESRAAERIAHHYDIQLSLVGVTGLGPFGAGYIPARNTILLAAALSRVGSNAQSIALGIHDGTFYVDASPVFAETVQRLFDIYTDGRVRLGCPFIEWTKRQIWDYCQSAAVPISLTYSCERGGDPPCGTCLSCRDREALGART